VFCDQIYLLYNGDAGLPSFLTFLVKLLSFFESDVSCPYAIFCPLVSVSGHGRLVLFIFFNFFPSFVPKCYGVLG